MLGGSYFITPSVVNNNVKTEKDFKSDSLQVGFEFEASRHLASHLCQCLIIWTGSREPEEMPFSWLFPWDVESKERDKTVSPVICCKVLAEVPGATLYDFLTLLYPCHLGVGEALWCHGQGWRLWEWIPVLLGPSRIACANHFSFLWLFSLLSTEVITMPTLLVCPQEAVTSHTSLSLAHGQHSASAALTPTFTTTIPIPVFLCWHASGRGHVVTGSDGGPLSIAAITTWVLK